MAPFSFALLTFYLLLSFFVLPGRVLAQCYFPGGETAPDYKPCDPNTFPSLCCRKGWTCFSNNLCIATDPSVVSSEVAIGTSYRGACTGFQWNITTCGNFCLGDPWNDNFGELVSCGNETWCCGPDYRKGNCDCKKGVGTFSLSEGHAVTIIGVGNLVHTATAAGPTTSSSSSSTSTSNTGASSSTTSPATASTSSVSSSTPGPSPTPYTVPTHKVRLGAGLGAGLGIPILIALVAAAIIYNRRGTLRCWKRRKSVFDYTPNDNQPEPPQYHPPIRPDNPYQATPDPPDLQHNPYGLPADQVEQVGGYRLHEAAGSATRFRPM